MSCSRAAARSTLQACPNCCTYACTNTCMTDMSWEDASAPVCTGWHPQCTVVYNRELHEAAVTDRRERSAWPALEKAPLSLPAFQQWCLWLERATVAIEGAALHELTMLHTEYLGAGRLASTILHQGRVHAGRKTRIKHEWLAPTWRMSSITCSAPASCGRPRACKVLYSSSAR